MKIRTGFVSNSSSSSFIIGANKSDFEGDCFTKKIVIEVPLERFVEKTIKTSDEFNKMIIDEYWYTEEDIKTSNFSEQDLKTIQYLDAHPDNYVVVLRVGDEYIDSLSQLLYNKREYITNNKTLNVFSEN